MHNRPSGKDLFLFQGATLESLIRTTTLLVFYYNNHNNITSPIAVKINMKILERDSACLIIGMRCLPRASPYR